MVIKWTEPAFSDLNDFKSISQIYVHVFPETKKQAVNLLNQKLM